MPGAVMVVVQLTQLIAPVAVTEPPLLVSVNPPPAVEAPTLSPLLSEVLVTVMLPDSAVACSPSVVVVSIIEPPLFVTLTPAPPAEAVRVRPLTSEVLLMVTLPLAVAVRLSVAVVTSIGPVAPLAVNTTVEPLYEPLPLVRMLGAVMLVAVAPLIAPVAVTAPPVFVNVKPAPLEARRVSPTASLLVMVTLPAAFACRLFVLVMTGVLVSPM